MHDGHINNTHLVTACLCCPKQRLPFPANMTTLVLELKAVESGHPSTLALNLVEAAISSNHLSFTASVKSCQFWQLQILAPFARWEGGKGANSVHLDAGPTKTRAIADSVEASPAIAALTGHGIVRAVSLDNVHRGGDVLALFQGHILALNEALHHDPGSRVPLPSTDWDVIS